MKNQDHTLTRALKSQLVELQCNHLDNNPYSLLLGEIIQTMSVGGRLYDKVIADENVPEYIEDFFHDYFGHSEKYFSDTMLRLTEIQSIISSVMMEVAARQAINDYS